MTGWRSSGECLRGLGIWKGLGLGQAIFPFYTKKGKSTDDLGRPGHTDDVFSATAVL